MIPKFCVQPLAKTGWVQLLTIGCGRSDPTTFEQFIYKEHTVPLTAWNTIHIMWYIWMTWWHERLDSTKSFFCSIFMGFARKFFQFWHVFCRGCLMFFLGNFFFGIPTHCLVDNETNPSLPTSWFAIISSHISYLYNLLFFFFFVCVQPTHVLICTYPILSYQKGINQVSSVIKC